MTETDWTAARPPVAWEAPASPGPSMATGDQPMSSNDIFQRAIQLYRRGFVILVAVAAIVQIPLAIVAAITGARISDALDPVFRAVSEGASPTEIQSAFQNALSQSSGSFQTYGLVSFLAGLLLSPALIATTAQLHTGSETSVGRAYRKALGAALRIFAGSIVQGIAIVALFLGILIVGLVLAVVFQNEPGLVALAIVLGFVVATVATLYVALRWSVWSVAVVLEGRGPLDALSRSWRFLKGNMWRTLAILFATSLAAAVAGGILGAIGGAIGGAISPGAATFVGDALAVLTVSWFPIVLTLLFLDLRARQGGPVMAAAPPEATWPTTPGPATPGPEEEPQSSS